MLCLWIRSRILDRYWWVYFPKKTAFGALEILEGGLKHAAAHCLMK